jgi:hypothetical protein
VDHTDYLKRILILFSSIHVSLRQNVEEKVRGQGRKGGDGDENEENEEVG